MVPSSIPATVDQTDRSALVWFGAFLPEAVKHAITGCCVKIDEAVLRAHLHAKLGEQDVHSLHVNYHVSKQIHHKYACNVARDNPPNHRVFRSLEPVVLLYCYTGSKMSLKHLFVRVWQLYCYHVVELAKGLLSPPMYIFNITTSTRAPQAPRTTTLPRAGKPRWPLAEKVTMWGYIPVCPACSTYVKQRSLLRGRS